MSDLNGHTVSAPFDTSSPEFLLVQAVLCDPTGDTWRRAQSLPIDALRFPESRAIWTALRSGVPVNDAAAIIQAAHLSTAHYVALSSGFATTALASLHLEDVRREWRSRRAADIAKRLLGDADPAELARELADLDSEHVTLPAIPLPSFAVPTRSDRSVLLGNRFLNRGDGGIIVSSSGMGKSSLYVLAAVLWSLGRPFFGIQPNSRLRSLLIQSEDSDGDIAEVWASIVHELALTPTDIATVADSVRVVTDRIHRGSAFIRELDSQIATHKPDLVWINPLVAFLDGDISKGQDAGQFLREGLNGLNRDARFGYILIHHTTKPPTDKGKSERNWSEVMYDMAGSYDLIGWARFIMSLRPTDKHGQFNLVLAKRGTRAGVVTEVEQGAGVREEITTTIPLRHSTDKITLSSGETIHSLMWHARDADAPKEKKSGGAPKKYPFERFAVIFPRDPKHPERHQFLWKKAQQIDPEISEGSFRNLCRFGVESGFLTMEEDGNGFKYHMTPA